MVNPHYNDIFKRFWTRNQRQVIYQPSCLERPYTCGVWPIRYPEVVWDDRTVVVMHAQDFLSIDSQGCPELRSIEQHFGDRSCQVIVIVWNYNLERVYQGLLNLIHFPTHSYEILMNFHKPNYRDRLRIDHPSRTRRWQCLNGVPRSHRRVVHQWLKDRPSGITGLGQIDPLPQDAYHDVYTWNGNPLINEDNFLKLSWLYDDTWINIVTETQYTEAPGIISEKTILAFLARQIPILIGYSGIVQDCRRLGFDMFDDIVDHSYDFAPDHDRWRLALEKNQDLLFGGRDLSIFWPRLDQQRSWLLNQWPGIMIENHDRRCREILHFLTKR